MIAIAENSSPKGEGRADLEKWRKRGKDGGGKTKLETNINVIFSHVNCVRNFILVLLFFFIKKVIYLQYALL